MQNHGLWYVDDSKNIESLVLEMKNDKKVDYTKLLLDVIPRSALGYEFTLEKVLKFAPTSYIDCIGFNMIVFLITRSRVFF